MMIGFMYSRSEQFIGGYIDFNKEALELSNLEISKEDTIKNNLFNLKDSLIGLKKDTLLLDTLAVLTTDTTKISKEALEAEVIYSANDSIRFEVDSQMVYLYGKAKVVYTSVELIADYIELSLKKNIVFAEGVADSSGKVNGKPEFKDGDQEFKSDKITYNFETKKGKIINVRTKQDEGYLHGDKVKKDSTDNIYMQHGTYTTCSNEQPHFWFEINKVKVIKDDKIVTGPTNLKIAGVPTPLALPFGFFPNKKGRANGIILPRPFDSEAFGFGLEEGGYYLGINDNMDLTLTGDIFARGSFRIGAASNYVKRYRYNGNFQIKYAYSKTGEKGFPDYSVQKDTRVNWNHTQDPKANPSSRFSASVDVGKTNRFAQRDLNLYLKNSMASSIRYDKIFLGTPFSMNLAATHSQNTETKKVEIDLPNVLFNMQSINPLGSKFVIGKPKWVSDLRLNYNSTIQNRISGNESQIFSNKKTAIDSTLNNMRNGARHSSSLVTNLKLLKYFVLSPSVNYDELWYLQTTSYQWNTINNKIDTTINRAFSRANNVSFNSAFRTVLYGTYLFKSGRVKGFRHTLTPTLNYSYNPGLTQNNSYYNADLKKSITYSKYDGGILGVPAVSKSSILTMGLTNFLEMKYKSKNDTLGTFQKVRLLDELSANTNYNFRADSMNWAPLSINARTVIFNNLNLNYNMTYNFYSLNVKNGNVTKDLMKDINGKLARLTNSNFNVGYSLKSKNTKSIIKTSSTATQQEIDEVNRNRDQYIDFNLPWQLTISYNLQYNKQNFRSTYVQVLRFNGDLSLTKKWKITFSSGWDFTGKDIVIPSLNIYRDLHCWEMNINIIPYGPTKQYSLNLNVKASVLQDMKLSRRRSWYDLQ
jgi:hypothetical protein